MRSSPAPTPPRRRRQADWRDAWEAAQRLWDVRLADPVDASGARERSFAWYSMPPQVHVDHAELERLGLAGHLASVYAHEIGHHVLAPATRLTGLAVTQQMARAVRASGVWTDDLPGVSHRLGNLWSDLLVNVRVARAQRRAGQDPPGIEEVYRRLPSGEGTTPLWWVVLRAYELLWGRPAGTLCRPDPPARAEAPRGRGRVPGGPEAGEVARLAAELREATRLDPVLDARLLAQTVETFGADPVSGALPAGMVLAPYLARDPAPDGAGGCAGEVDGLPATPDELGEVLRDPRLSRRPVHPAVARAAGDGRPGGAEGADGAEQRDAGDAGGAGSGQGFGLAATLELYAGTDEADVTAAWYQAGARRWVSPLRQRSGAPAMTGDGIPGPVEVWEAGDDLTDLDWPATLGSSPTVVPGVTTRRRTSLPDPPPAATESVRLDLYVDSSGSMTHPAHESPAVLAGTVLVLSVLRGGGRVRVTSFSGPGQVAGSEGFTRDRRQAMRDLLRFFGGGTTFPLDLYGRRYLGERRLGDVRRHVAVLSDDGLVSMFGQGQEVFKAVAEDVRRVLDTATLVVQDGRRQVADAAARAGYDVEYVTSMADAPEACRRLAERIAAYRREEVAGAWAPGAG